VAAALDPALGPLDRQLGRLGLGLRGALEAAARDGRAAGGPRADLLGANPGEDHVHGDLRMPLRERPRHVQQQRAGTGAGRTADRHARALTERGRLERRRRGQPLGREDGRQVAEPGALLRRLGIGAVDRLHPDQRGVALVAAWGPHRAAQLVAGAQLAAADLGRRDVDVVARLAGGVEAQEAGAVREHVEHARGDLLVGDLVLHLGLLLDHVLLALRGRHLERLVRGDLVRLAVDFGRLGLRLGLGLGLRFRFRFRFRFAALRGEDRPDQVVLALGAESLEAELGRDRVEVGERALLELSSLEDWHGLRNPTSRLP
jgi:hypothetical protein